MSSKRIAFWGFAAALMIVYVRLVHNTILSIVFTLITLFIGYVLFARTVNSFRNRRFASVQNACDPEAFMKVTEKEIKYISKQNQKSRRTIRYLCGLYMFKAFALMDMGQYTQAKEVLLTLDTECIAKNDLLILYRYYMLLCLYGLEEVEQAEELYEQLAPKLKLLNERMPQMAKLLYAERYFYKAEYRESKKQYQRLLNEKLYKNMRLKVLYRLAQIDQKLGNPSAAKAKYKEIIENGNKLWIVTQAQQNLGQL